jgi:mono/diheme cytochrome c family protein
MLAGVEAATMRSMHYLAVLTICLLIFPAFLNAQTTSASPLRMLGRLDATKGELVFREKGCFGCHSYDGWGGAFGPDLGSKRIRGTSPSSLAAAMWNQAPFMWRSISSGAPSLTLEESAALYSFFYSRLYFNEYPDTPNGEDYFKANCGSCHDLRPGAQKQKQGPPASTWNSIKDPIVLAGLMWNHSTTMLDRINRDFKTWPRMTGQNVTDLLAYLWKLPEIRPLPSTFQFGNDEAGEHLFNQHCSECHTIGKKLAGHVDLNSKLTRKTLPELAASMWSHAPAMKISKPGVQLPTLSDTEIRDLATFLVLRPVFAEEGNAVRGARVFQSKRCADCHEGRVPNTGAPPSTSFTGPFDPVRMTSVLWSHGPAMLAKMKQAGIAWPHFNTSEMLDLLTYLNHSGAR